MDSRGTSYGSDANKGGLWSLNQQLDEPIDLEASRITRSDDKKMSSVMLLQLSFQSLGIVYGDLGTSPLYVFYNTFPHGIKNPEDVIGVLSLIIYSLTLVTLLKYVLIICNANDNGHGGTFALYSLLCRHANIRTLPNQDQTDEELTTYGCPASCKIPFDARTKNWLERYAILRNALLILVLIGSCLVIGDGILTPAISVLSAVGGFKLAKPMSDEIVVTVSVIIIIGLFSLQQCGTEKVGWLFAPIVLLWLLLIGGVGIFNLCKHGIQVLKAFSPVYIYRYLKRGGMDGWTSLGGVLLCITGTEALFADLSQFPVSAIQIAFTLVVFPCLLLAYTGQAAYLLKNPDHVFDVFYRFVPDSLYWPALIMATGAAIVASQSIITATFSLIKQALAHGCFPRVKVVHTSRKFQRQIYVPDINWILMVICVAVTAGFRKQSQIGTAFGTAVVLVMMVTTFLMVLIMVMVWRCHWSLVILFTILSLAVEGPYFFAVIFKIDQGGWVPLAIGAAFFIIMYSWHYTTVKRYEHEMHSTVSLGWILSLGPSLGLVQVPGVGFVYTELVSGVPRIFSHWITHLPAIHSVLVFVCIKYLPVHTVHERERFLVKRVGPTELHMFRCVVRYGYKDLHKKDDEFEGKLLDSLLKFIQLEYLMEGDSDSDSDDGSEQSLGGETSIPIHPISSHHSFHSNIDSVFSSSASILEAAATPRIRSSSGHHKHPKISEREFLMRNRDAGVVHILGNTVVNARTDSSLFKKFAINYMYALLKKICRGNRTIFHVPQESLLSVGQSIHV